MSTLSELKAKNPDIFAELGVHITQGVFSNSTNFPNVTSATINAANGGTGVQVVVGGTGNDTISVRDGNGDVVVFGGPGNDRLNLLDITLGTDWEIGEWRTAGTITDYATGTQKQIGGLLFYNETTDQTIATGDRIETITLGSGDVIRGSLTSTQIATLESIGAYLGTLNMDKLIEQEFLPEGTTDSAFAKIIQFFAGAPHLYSDRDLGKSVVLEEASVFTGTDSADVVFSEVGGHNIRMEFGLDFVDLRGTTESNIVNGGNQGDTILGGDGGDELRGGKGLDSIIGGAGDDTIYSGLGRDTLTGGDGADIFVLRGFDPVFQNALLAPTVTDFQAGIDKIAMQGVSDAEIATALAGQAQVSGGVQFTIAGATVTVQGVSSLAASDIGTAAFFGV
jgi:Ca2+-binding RTX toxin-like protein